MSLQSLSVLILSVAASAAITARRFVSVSGGVPAAGAASWGVATSNAASGELIPVANLGTEVVEMGGAVAVNGLVETDNQGRAIAKDTGITLGRLAPGQPAATAAGQFREIVLIPS